MQNTNDILNQFKEKYKNTPMVLDAIAYHREKDKDIYNRRLK